MDGVFGTTIVSPGILQKIVSISDDRDEDVIITSVTTLTALLGHREHSFLLLERLATDIFVRGSPLEHCNTGGMHKIIFDAGQSLLESSPSHTSVYRCRFKAR
jgi:hypothetical protein